jgi:hypothetical protein
MAAASMFLVSRCRVQYITEYVTEEDQYEQRSKSFAATSQLHGEMDLTQHYFANPLAEETIIEPDRLEEASTDDELL